MGHSPSESTARHVISRALKDTGQVIKAAGLSSISAEYLQKLRTTCLRLASAHLPNATPKEVVRDAKRRYRNCLSFLTGSES
jgi:hypothetical protein